MKVASWNVAGLRALIKKADTIGLQEFIESNDFDAICLQEIKCLESQVKLPEFITQKYPHRYWNENKGITQKKGLSGVCIWSKVKGVELPTPEFDVEGRIKSVIFENFILVTVYVPNSQCIGTPRYDFRVNVFDELLRNYVMTLNEQKPVIICGDFNVVSQPIDYHSFKKNQNKSPGLYDAERDNFHKYFQCNFVDAFRFLYPDKVVFSYWSNLCKNKTATNGWLLDRVLLPNSLKANLVDCDIIVNQLGSDHRPVTLELSL